MGSMDEHIKYFKRDVLDFYRKNSHMYELVEDDMGGEIEVSKKWTEKDTDEFPRISLKFAFRKLANGKRCLGVFMPTFKSKVSEMDFSKWMANHISEPIFNDENDAFDRWVKRNIYASPFVEDGPMINFQKELELINALTKIKFNTVLFKHEKHSLINYPFAENNEEYTKSILELYRLLIDSMEKCTIIKLAKSLNKSLTDDSKRLNSLKEILPISIYNPIHNISKKRMPIHGIPSDGTVSYPAFDEFDSDLRSLNNALVEFKEWLEEKFGLCAELCRRRLESLAYFPKINKSPTPECKYDNAQKMIGKQISRVEFGEVEFDEGLHSREAIIIHFEDGSAMSIRVGSNVNNIIGSCEKLRPSDFDTDLMLTWAVSPLVPACKLK